MKKNKKNFRMIKVSVMVSMIILVIFISTNNVSGGVPHILIKIYVDDDAPNDPGPGNPAISDPLEDGSADHPFDAIQEGIDAANPQGSLKTWVVVLDGTYTGEGNKEISFHGKKIKVTSQTGPENCIIDLQNNGRAFDFYEGETRDACLEGFQIINGSSGNGAAIRIGRYNDHNYKSDPTIENCLIEYNTADQSDGGGIYVGRKCGPRIFNCSIRHNSATFHGGGISTNHWCEDLDIDGCIIEDNSAEAGAGIWVHDQVQGVTIGIIIRNCTIIGNISAWDGGGISMGYNTRAEIYNCIIAKNTADNNGGGLRIATIFEEEPILITNCTFFDNYAENNGGGFFCHGYDPTLYNVILWNDSVGTGDGPEMWIKGWSSSSTSEAEIHHSDVDNGLFSVYVGDDADLTWGGNMINADPMFVDSENDDYHLLFTSPCIEAGTNIDVYYLDFEGDPRPFDGDRSGTAEADMGADEFILFQH